MSDLIDSVPIIPKKKRNKKKVYKYPVVVVHWDDAESEPNWIPEPTKDLQPTMATTIGFLIKESENHILVADSYFDDTDNTIGNTVKIPRGMIKEMTFMIKSGYKKAV